MQIVENVNNKPFLKQAKIKVQLRQYLSVTCYKNDGTVNNTPPKRIQCIHTCRLSGRLGINVPSGRRSKYLDAFGASASKCWGGRPRTSTIFIIWSNYTETPALYIQRTSSTIWRLYSATVTETPSSCKVARVNIKSVTSEQEFIA